MTRGRDEPAETVVYRATGAELALLGLTSNRIGALLVGLFALFEFADELGLGATVIGAGGDLLGRLAAQSTPLLIALVAVALFLLLLSGWLVGVIASFVKFHGFTLVLRDDVLQRRFGLLTTRAQSLPRRRVQRVLLEQNVLRRVLDLVVVRADSAGSGMDSKEELRSGRDVIAPLTARPVGERLVPWLLRGLDVEGLAFERVSPRVVGRIFAEGALAALVLAVGGWFAVGAWSALAALLLPIAWLFGWLAYRNLGLHREADHIALRWGILGRYRAYVPLHKVQAVQLQAGPIDRAFGLASVVVYVAGGSPTRLDYLPREQAEVLEMEIADCAARTRFVW